MASILAGALILGPIRPASGQIPISDLSAKNSRDLQEQTDGDRRVLCPDGSTPRADLGIRYRFTAGDFVRQSAGGTWVHFHTEPVVASVGGEGPAAGILRPGDVIVAVDHWLITTREGSYRFQVWTARRLELRILRDGRPERVVLNPRRECPSAPEGPDGDSAEGG